MLLFYNFNTLSNRSFTLTLKGQVPRSKYVQIKYVTIMTAQNMLGYRNIIAAVAIHVVGHPAVARAANIAKKIQCGITLVHAAGGTLSPTIPKVDLNSSGDESTEIGELMRELQLTHPDANQIRLLTGHWSALVGVAHEIGADLIVIGSYVHGQLQSLMGETSDQVLHHAKSDVLVVHSELYDETHPPVDYKRIIATTDLSGRGYGAVRRAARMSDTFGAELILLNAIEHFPTDRENDRITPENRDPVEYQTSLRREDLQELAGSLELADVQLDVIVANQTAKRSIPEYARKKQADLIVIGARDQYGLDVLLGNTADGIIHHTPCDVLVVHETVEA